MIADTDAVLARVIEHLRQHQRERPWLMGVTSLGLARAVSIAERDLAGLLAPALEAHTLTYRSGYYATPDFKPRLSPEQSAFFEHAFGTQTPAPIAFELLRARIRHSSIAELAQAFETLIASGALSKVGDFVYHGSHIEVFRAQLEAALREHGQVTVAEFRDRTGTTRKYAVPLLEFFDATGLTLRRGDVRVRRQPPPARD